MLTQPDTKIIEFNTLVEELCSMTDNYLLRQALDAEPRCIQDMARHISALIYPRVELSDVVTLVQIIELKGSTDDIDPKIKFFIDVDKKARLVYRLYADIHGLEARETKSHPLIPPTIWVDWSLAAEVDEITG